MQSAKHCETESFIKPLAVCQASAERDNEQDIYILEFDGASKGNPGRAGAGAILKRPDGTVLCQLTRGVGRATCNFAEYQALIMGLQAALDRGIRHIRAQGDSKLVCCQLMGSWRVNSSNLSASFSEAKKLKEGFHSFSIQHVYREFNAAADTLANIAVKLPDGGPVIQCSSSPDPKKTSKKHKVGSKKATKGAVITQSPCTEQDVWSQQTKGSSFSSKGNENFYRLDYHGASNGKNASAGAALFSPDGTLKLEISEGLGLATRNVAQYQALVIGLRAALECNVSHVKIQGDALLVYKQMLGSIKVKDGKLQALCKEANDLLTKFSESTITHVEKSQNSVACALAEVALQSADSWSKTDKIKLGGTSRRNGMLDMGTLKVQTCLRGGRTFNKVEKSLESSIKRFSMVARSSPLPICARPIFSQSFSNQRSRAPTEMGPQPLPISLSLSKCLPLYAAETSIQRIVLWCASSRVKSVPHIFGRSLMHVQARCVYKCAFSTSIFR